MGSNSTTIPTTSVAELKYLSLLARDYPTQAAAASAVILHGAPVFCILSYYNIILPRQALPFCRARIIK